MTIVFLHFSTLLQGAPCLPADSPAQILLQLINHCEPVIPPHATTSHYGLPADSSPSTTVARNQTHISRGNSISLIVI
ncbi:hypothetical protein AVEN_202894-1 [Araneus ventricosus]|uniref:Secreted protein n=1 Tax=Araneus ventricosus TaxID=182803 RepID=A0A4Y2FJK5_ARAVE|nr:hypothetical protein AVEN_202894-1 [Araneus ventricosus]